MSVEKQYFALTEIAKITISISLLIISKWPGRGPVDIPSNSGIERWQVLEAAELTFQGIHMDRTGIDLLVSEFQESRAKTVSHFDALLPPALNEYFDPIRREKRDKRHNHLLVQHALVRLAYLVAIVATIQSPAKCAEMPILVNLSNLSGGGEHLEPSSKNTRNPFSNFYSCCQMLVGAHFMAEEGKHSTFMVSDFGWTVYLPSLGDVDPTSLNPEHVCVHKGVPSNARTGERKYRVRDSSPSAFKYYEHRVTDRGPTYIPRCLSKV